MRWIQGSASRRVIISRWRLSPSLYGVLLWGGGILAAPLAPCKASRAGLRVYEAGRHRRIPWQRIRELESAVARGHQPWRSDPLLTAQEATRNLLPGRQGDWQITATRTGTKHPALVLRHARHRDSALYAMARRDRTSAIIALTVSGKRYRLLLCRPIRSVWWLTNVERLAR